jgi:uncharacterized membrane protein YdbT with pleckstrin-like domain
MADEIIKYAPLGGKTLFVFIFKGLAIPFLLLVVLLAAIIAKPFVPFNYAGYASLAILAATVFFLIVTAFVFLVGWLQYIRYKIIIDGESIKISRGILTEEQIGIPFRRVKDAAIERSLVDQLIGISNITLTVLGVEDGNAFSNETKISLPALDKKIALDIQDVILKRAEVEEMKIQPK